MAVRVVAFPSQPPARDAATVAQTVSCLLVQGTAHLAMLRAAKTAWEGGDEVALKSIFAQVDASGNEGYPLPMEVYEVLGCGRFEKSRSLRPA